MDVGSFGVAVVATPGPRDSKTTMVCRAQCSECSRRYTERAAGAVRAREGWNRPWLAFQCLISVSDGPISRSFRDGTRRVNARSTAALQGLVQPVELASAANRFDGPASTPATLRGLPARLDLGCERGARESVCGLCLFLGSLSGSMRGAVCAVSTQ